MMYQCRFSIDSKFSSLKSFSLEVPPIAPVIVNPALFLMERSVVALAKYNVTVVKMWNDYLDMVFFSFT